MNRPSPLDFPEHDETRSRDAADVGAPPAMPPDDTAERSAVVAKPGTDPRRWALTLSVLVVVGAAIWYLESSRGPPFVNGSDAGDAAQSVDDIPASTTGFVSFESRGIKLGAAGGSAPQIGQPAPDFTLLDLEGRPVSLSGFRGSTVLMNFWATWCPPCRKEFPELVRLYDRNAGRGLVVLSVDLQERPEIVRRFAEGFGARFPIVIDQKGDVGGQYRLLGLPTTLFIDADGILRAQHVGVLTEEILKKKLGDARFTMAGGQEG